MSRWLWTDRPYVGDEKIPVELGRARGSLSGGTYWDVWDNRARSWVEAEYSGLLNYRHVFPRVAVACLALTLHGRPGDAYRLCRLDDHQPLLVARRDGECWTVLPWDLHTIRAVRDGVSRAVAKRRNVG